MNDKKFVKLAYRICHDVCQVLAHLENDCILKVTGDPDSPLSCVYRRLPLLIILSDSLSAATDFS